MVNPGFHLIPQTTAGCWSNWIRLHVANSGSNPASSKFRRVNSGVLVEVAELLSQFHRVEQLSPAKKALVKEFLDAFLFKDHVKGQLA